MLYAWIGFLKPDAEPVSPQVQREISDFIAQPYIKIHAVGPLHDQSGQRAGMMMLFDIADRAAAESFIESSPYLKAGVYERHDLFEYRSEVGEF